MSFIARSIKPFVAINRYYTTAAADSLVTRLKNDRKTFMKAKKQPDLNVVKGVMSDFTYYVKSPNYVEGISEEQAMLSVIQKAIKRRQDSVEQFRAGGRPELAEQELQELKVLESYLPEKMSAEAIQKEVEMLIEELGVTNPKDMGKVMKAWKYDSATADRKIVSDTVKKLLNK